MIENYILQMNSVNNPQYIRDNYAMLLDSVGLVCSNSVKKYRNQKAYLEVKNK